MDNFHRVYFYGIVSRMMTKRSGYRLITVLINIFLASCSSLLASTITPTLVYPPSATATVQPTNTPSPTHTATPTDTPAPTITPTPTPIVLLGAGDIAYCGEAHLGDEMTRDLLADFPDAVIFTAGDNVQGEGTRAEFRNCFGPSWGVFKDRIHPSPGNHDYDTEDGAPYYEYFGRAAGEAGQGFYSYDIGDWHMIALNSNCDNIACGPNSKQHQWLRQNLEANNSKCTLLYWHHPRFSSGLAGNYGSVNSFWRSAVELGGDIVVNGHDHDYERFAPMDSEGNADPNGMQLFIVGTGGTTLRDFGEIKPNSEVRYNGGNGIIKFNLYPGWYEWEFIPTIPGDFSDSGSGVCR